MSDEIRQPANIDRFVAQGADEELMKQQLFKESQGRELYFQSVEDEEGRTTMFGYPRTQVMDRIYELAYPVIKLLDDRAILKVKSNRAVTDFFLIVQSRRPASFIGKHGMTLDAVENLIAQTVSRTFPRWVSMSVDIDNYRRKRQAYLEGLIRRVIRDIERDHRERPIRDLLPKERKFVHAYFTNHPYLTTESRGEPRMRTLYIMARPDIKEV
jgi:spoIIIJ-associated protein